MPLPRLTMLVLPRDATPTLVIPRLEVARVIERGDSFAIRGWEETEDPIAVVAELCGSVSTAAIGDQTWARHLVDLMGLMPKVSWRRSVELVGPLRARKDQAEIDALAAAAAAADRVAVQLQGGEIPLIGRRESEVSEDISRRLLAEGHSHVNFAIVAAGENASSPHHHASDRVIKAGEVVLCDFGGAFSLSEGEPGYCSDMTRMIYTGPPPAQFRELYDVLFAAQATGVAAATIGTAAQDVRPGHPPGDRRCGLRRAVHPPHRPRHRAVRTRGSLHRGGQRHPAGGRATPFPSSPASTWKGGGGHGWKTSSWPRRTGRAR